jgi:hypothetical protein
MFFAAPVAAVGSALVLPLTNAGAESASLDPRMMAVVFGTSLLLTWVSLITGKLREGKKPGPFLVRRAQTVFLGGLVGLAGFGLAELTHVGPTSHRLISLNELTMISPASRSLAEGAIEFASFFGLIGLLAPSWKAATRDRKSRLGFLPFVWTGLVGGGLAFIFPAVSVAGAVAAGVASLTTSLVSPFNRESSKYAKEAARRAA